MIGVNPDCDSFYDPQQGRVPGWCVECGAEIWERGEELCSRCRRSAMTADIDEAILDG